MLLVTGVLVLVGLTTGYRGLIFNHEIIEFVTRIKILGFVSGSKQNYFNLITIFG